jgi:hypothetical protein
MAEETPKAVVKAAAGGPSEHDRVAMLSLHADGTPAQVNPELIGDPEFALEATKEQLRQQRVSAVDFEERSAAAAAAGEVAEDPTIAALKAKHDEAAKQAEADAEKVVKGLTS